MYRIKFLEHQKVDETGLEPTPVYRTVAYSDADIEIASCHWKAMGFKRVVDIEIIEPKDGSKPKRTAAEIVSMFYNHEGKVNGKPFEINITPADLKVKALLEKEYGKFEEKKEDTGSAPDQPSGSNDTPEEPEWKKSPEAEKEMRDKVIEKLKENEISFSHNTKTENLIKKLSENGIEL